VVAAPVVADVVVVASVVVAVPVPASVVDVVVDVDSVLVPAVSEDGGAPQAVRTATRAKLAAARPMV
jgi:hypothetical protein